MIEKEELKLSDEELRKLIDGLYPLAIISDRYGGVYSGGNYTAWICGIDYIPEGVFGDDVSCMVTWNTLKSERELGEYIYGVGNSIDETLRDLAYYVLKSRENKEEN